MLEWSKPVIGLSGGLLGAVVHESSVLYERFSIGRCCWAVFVAVLGAGIGLWLTYAACGELYPLIGGWVTAASIENQSYGRQLVAMVIGRMSGL